MSFKHPSTTKQHLLMKTNLDRAGYSSMVLVGSSCKLVINNQPKANMNNSGEFIITASRVFAACIRVHHVIKQNKTTATTCLMDFRTMFMGFQNCSIHGISSIDHGQTISSRQHGIGKQHHVTSNSTNHMDFLGKYVRFHEQQHGFSIV